MRNVDKKYHYLYKTTNLLNNKYYYGMHSTNKLDDGYLGSGKVLKYSIRKYGKENFKKEIISFYNSREELANAEKEIITNEMLNEKLCMNLKQGGSGGLGGMVTVKDKKGLCFNIFKDDPRYLSGEIVSVATNRICVQDKDGNILSVYRDDERYLNGELIPFNKNKVIVQDKNNNKFYCSINDERYLSGELNGCTKNMLMVKDIDENTYHVFKDDERYLSGELVHVWVGKQHSDETKKKISEKAKLKMGEKNSQFGTCWITKNNENKKIKKEELNKYITDGWTKGRKMK